MTVKYDTKIAVVLRDDLPVWQKLNITAFTVSGIAGTVKNVIGENYVDGSGNIYLPMFRQPVLVFSTSREKLRTVYERAMRRGVQPAIFTEELFSTFNDEDNRAAVKKVSREDLNLVGSAFRDDKKAADKILKGVSLHK